MKLFRKLFLLLICSISLTNYCNSQPKFLFQYQGNAPENFSFLSPDSKLNFENSTRIVIKNTSKFKIGFQLSFNTKIWTKENIEPYYSQVFSLDRFPGCYIKLITEYRSGEKKQIVYFLNMAKCYDIYWDGKVWNLIQEPKPCLKGNE